MKHVLVASLGGAPQVLTEALWALMHPRQLIDPAHRDRASVIVSEVHVLATSHCWPYDSIRERDDAINTRIAALHEQYGKKPPKVFIIPLTDETGATIPDVRRQDQNVVYANAVTGLIRRLSGQEAVRIHMLLAGGRKSMSSYDQSAMMFFADNDDELMHVLIEPPVLEGCLDFWWPGQLEKVVTTRQGDRFPTDPEAARVDLVNVPFVRLGIRLPDGVPLEAIDYGFIVEFAQFEQSQARVVIDMNDCSVTVGSQKLVLSETYFILLALLAIARVEHWPGAGPESEGVGDNARGWVLLDELRYGAAEGTRRTPLTKAAQIRDLTLARARDERTIRQKTVRTQGQDRDIADDWVARAMKAHRGDTDETSVIRSRCASELRDRIANPFIASRLAPSSYGRGKTAAIGIELPPDRIALRGFEDFLRDLP